MKKHLLYYSEVYKIMECAYEVHNTLGYGFLEKIYQNSLAFELKLRGFKVETEFPLTVYYKEQKVGQYFVDLSINEKILLELKAQDIINNNHFPQVLNYLKGTKNRLALLINFGKHKCEFKRIIL